MVDALEGLEFDVEPWGPDQEAFDEIRQSLLEDRVVREKLHGAQYRLLELKACDAGMTDGKAVGFGTPPDRYCATFYDYTNDRTLVAQGRFDHQGTVELAESARQPLPTYEEFEAAAELVLGDREIRSAVAMGDLLPYRPMPPLVEEQLADGRSRRLVTVGLVPASSAAHHEIVGVNLLDGSVHRFEHGAPIGSIGPDAVCGSPSARQATVRGAAGQLRLTVRQGGTVLWTMLVLRPAASSGTRGSGVELRNVSYKGKSVLYRAHVPILNVSYDGNRCGPYRDWQNEEGAFQANLGADLGNGFRHSIPPAQTILDTGSDVGNFNGVALSFIGQEFVLVSEMEAGWYRYISEWRFHADGMIRPRFGFSAVENPCVCNLHYHHAYWRFDFDIGTSSNNVIREFNDPGGWQVIRFETSRPRDPARNRRWRVENLLTGEGYEVIPGPTDGTASNSADWPYGRGDVWLLQYKGAEHDDGRNCTGGPGCATEADIDRFVNGELIEGADVVMWYGAHFTHDPAAHSGHLVGPLLRPINW